MLHYYTAAAAGEEPLHRAGVRRRQRSPGVGAKDYTPDITKVRGLQSTVGVAIIVNK